MIGKDDIKVSVICTTFNHEKYIKDALEGFVNQKTNFKFEIIIHDDASTDNTVNIIKEYVELYPDLIVPIFQEENQYSKNIKIVETFIKDKVRGGYIALCEGDDYWTDINKLQKQYDFLESHSDYVACVHQTIMKNCENNNETLISKYNTNCDLELFDVVCEWGRTHHTSSLFMRNEFYVNRPPFFYIIPRVGDLPLSVNLLLNGKVWYINDTMSVYRIFSNPFSWSSRMNSGEKEIIQKKNYELNQSEIELLKAIDCYSKKKYHKIFKHGIAIHTYNMNNCPPFGRRFIFSWYQREMFFYGKTLKENIHDLIGLYCNFQKKKDEF